MLYFYLSLDLSLTSIKVIDLLSLYLIRQEAIFSGREECIFPGYEVICHDGGVLSDKKFEGNLFQEKSPACLDLFVEIPLVCSIITSFSASENCSLGSHSSTGGSLTIFAPYSLKQVHKLSSVNH